MASTDVSARLKAIREAGIYRELRAVQGAQGTSVTLDGREVLLLCSNNYLGLAGDGRVTAAAADTALRLGAGSGASRSVSGTMELHEQLEASLASFKRTETALLFGSGYLANIGVLGALADEGVVFSDELNHASIVDGCRLARAETVIYAHRDLDQLEQGLRDAGAQAKTIVTDSVFSMDGDLAPLAPIRTLADEYDALLIVDEAHGTGCVGPGGRGALAEAGVEADVIVGTLGKALGSYGAYAACSRQLRELLINSARSFIFTTAPAPPSVAAAQTALEILIDEPQLPGRLQANAALLSDKLRRLGLEATSETQIIPLVVGDPDLAVRASALALSGGVFAQAIRPPTVPQGGSRLRLTVMATHTETELSDAATVLAKAVRA